MLQVCLQQSWPQDKPISKIVFPAILPSSLGNFATLCLMLPPQEIQYYLFSKPHSQFVFINSPHPMLLWVTVLQSTAHDSRLLPCYLDLKTSKVQTITRCLADKGFYRLLLFSTEEPQRCNQVITVTLTPQQCQMLQESANTGQTSQPIAQPIVSRRILKLKFEQLKSQVSNKWDSLDRFNKPTQAELAHAIS